MVDVTEANRDRLLEAVRTVVRVNAPIQQVRLLLRLAIEQDDRRAALAALSIFDRHFDEASVELIRALQEGLLVEVEPIPF